MLMIVMISDDTFKTNYKRERVKVSSFFAEMLYQELRLNMHQSCAHFAVFEESETTAF
jgi:hypothetical protein